VTDWGGLKWSPGKYDGDDDDDDDDDDDVICIIHS
jgi:hypothetical protein